MHRPIQDILKSLTNQPPLHDGVIQKMEEVRIPARQLAESIYNLCPDTRERSLAITHLEETVMWAIKSIALYQV